MKSLNFLLLIFLFVRIINSQAQTNIGKTETERITETLINYIESSTRGQPDRSKIAFYPDLNFYYIDDSELKIWRGKTGKIVSINYGNDKATAEVQISPPDNKTPYIDYYQLAKINNKWIIITDMWSILHELSTN